MKIGQFSDLMHEEGDQIQKKEIEREVICAMTEIVIGMIALIFKGIESFVLNFPSGPCSSCKIFDVGFANKDIGDPCPLGCDLAADPNEMFEKMDVVFFLLGFVERNLVAPFINVLPPFGVNFTKGFTIAKAMEIADAFIKEFMAVGLCNQNKGHAVFFGD